MSRDDLKVDASGDGEGEQDEETSEDAENG
jgi:hypothetical protein